MADLRQRFTEPRGIVIPTGNKTFRFACHLIVSLRRVFKTTLPIQVVYAGNTDLPEAKRNALQSLASLRTEDGEVEHGDISFLDVTEVFDDSTLGLTYGGWAIKVFAALASKFTEVILLDADAVFFQDPISLLKQKAYQDNGALFFHDRLLWQYDFRERHQWWHSQVIREGPNLNKSLVWTETYAEEQDSGVVVVDKSRLDVVLGLLHVAWQNTRDVREETTYKMTYGDKEAWWFGFELTNTGYAFEKHYGGIVGWGRNVAQLTSTANITSPPTQPERVCSFVISHVDESDKLLWYNGGLLKNKITDKREFEVPTHWMMDAEWEKGANKPDMSCMKRGIAMELTDAEKEIIKRSIEEAQSVDIELNLV
ncbi:putative glycosyltransferase family 71 protein [Diaporthe ampelina]|uniref:Putative glycosyltransferase family 71 protein n=1 Tax=Diaporthe ampelina TaxID=1214573 RepID=A0A0G2HV86_9PEZI|nr:putative glycosyltransferase family 71 protein [Diaporthe ampelina]